MDYVLLCKLAAHVAVLVELDPVQGCKPFFFKVGANGRWFTVYMRFNAIGLAGDRIQIKEPTGTYASESWSDFCNLQGHLIA